MTCRSLRVSSSSRKRDVTLVGERDVGFHLLDVELCALVWILLGFSLDCCWGRSVVCGLSWRRPGLVLNEDIILLDADLLFTFLIVADACSPAFPGHARLNGFGRWRRRRRSKRIRFVLTSALYEMSCACYL